MTTTVELRGDGSLGRLSWEFLEPFGARLYVESLRDDLDDAEQTLLRQLLYERGFIEAGHVQLSKTELRRLGGYVAPLLPEEDEANPVLAVKAEEGGFGTRSLAFHRDLSYAEHPFYAIALHALTVNPGETSTFIASGTRAYDKLPASLKSQIAGLEVLTALHGRDDNGRPTSEADSPGWPSWIHPLVAPHPMTGAPVLFVCEMSSVRIPGMTSADSEALLQELFSYVRAEDNVCEHKWYDEDLLIWDNFGCLHARKRLDGVSKRTLQRLTMGPLSFPMAYPDFSMRDFTDTYAGNNYMGNGGGRF